MSCTPETKLVLNYGTELPSRGQISMMTEVPRDIRLKDLNILLDKIVASIARQKILAEIQDLEQRTDTNRNTLRVQKEIDLTAAVRDAAEAQDASSQIQVEAVKNRIYNVELQIQQAVENIGILKDRADALNRESDS